MSGIQFLSVEQVLAIHQRMIERYGGDSGLRDLGLIDSAVMMPQQAFAGEYLHPTVSSMAAAYLYHLAANHGLVDGNKRVAVGAALVFLDVNGWKLRLTIDELERITLDVAASRLDKAGLTELFEAAIEPKP